MTQSELAAQSIEWPRLLRLAQAEARTDLGKEKLGTLTQSSSWAQSLDASRHRQRETQQIQSFLANESLWSPLTDLASPLMALDRLGKGAILDLTDLGNLKRWIYAGENWRTLLDTEIFDDADQSLFRNAVQSLPLLSVPLHEIDHLLTPEGELSENASPRLAQLFQEVRILKREISIVLDGLLKTFSQQGVLQENFSDVREGRYVLPIKISSQKDVDGIIYESSVSRQTVFVEPREVAGLNNRLKQRQSELQQEIFTLLHEISKKLYPFTAFIAAEIEIISHWDTVQARARLGQAYGGKSIEVVKERQFRMHNTVHPLLIGSLPPDQITRNHLSFGDPTLTLLLTGPNTGGKTVLLKTLGLAGVCARTGFLFPASETVHVPFFDTFFADLGDPQSLEQHLSSFSGHIARFKQILENVTSESLVLIDELNSATDPEEGAALGRAFLEMIMRKGATLVTTTHDPQLKAMAISDPRILSAGMEFDEKTRTPTYRILIGTPGRSRAIETAERLGIPAEMLALARSYLSDHHIQFETLIAKLQSDASDAARLRSEAERLHGEALSLQQEWKKKVDFALETAVEKTRAQLRKSLEQAQSQFRDQVLKIEGLRTLKETQQVRNTLTETASVIEREILDAVRSELPKSTVSRSPLQTQGVIEVGVQVKVPRWKTTGVVVELQGNKAKVAMGNLQMVIPLNELEYKGKPLPTAANRNIPTVSFAPPEKLDIRGMRFDDAMTELSRYLDQSFRSRAFSQITVVHGLGTGSLREGTRKLLGQLPYIKNFRDGGVGQGGAGATLIEFDFS